MEYINEKVVLEFYLKELEADKINFLRGHHKQRVKERVEKLLEGGSIHSKIEAAKNLWKALFEASMSYIDPDKRGYDKIFKYFDEFVNFEELIFASDSFYRDHTLHSLWVYFLGEYVVRREEFEFLLKNTMIKENVYRKLKNDLEECKKLNILNELTILIEELNMMMNQQGAARCVAALCHDLGYPLKKIEKINKSIRGVLPYFSINNIEEFKFKYTEVEQLYIKKFIEILSSTVMGFSGDDTKVEDESEYENLNELMVLRDGNIEGVNVDIAKKLTEKEKKLLNEKFEFKCRIVSNSDDYLAYSRNFEEYKHGIMSAFLLMKNLKAFEKINLKLSSEEIKLSEIKFAEIISKQSILLAITEHTNDNHFIRSLSTDNELLTFIDELEEFSRISRANKNREYVEEFCHTKLFMEDGWFNVHFIFDNDNLGNLDPERAFKGRCERFLKLFDIPSLSENLKIRLKCIGKLQFDDNEYTLEIARKYAKITINGEEKFIPRYLKSTEYYSREEYEEM